MPTPKYTELSLRPLLTSAAIYIPHISEYCVFQAIRCRWRKNSSQRRLTYCCMLSPETCGSCSCSTPTRAQDRWESNLPTSTQCFHFAASPYRPPFSAVKQLATMRSLRVGGSSRWGSIRKVPSSQVQVYSLKKLPISNPAQFRQLNSQSKRRSPSGRTKIFGKQVSLWLSTKGMSFTNQFILLSVPSDSISDSAPAHSKLSLSASQILRNILYNRPTSRVDRPSAIWLNQQLNSPKRVANCSNWEGSIVSRVGYSPFMNCSTRNSSFWIRMEGYFSRSDSAWMSASSRGRSINTESTLLYIFRIRLRSGYSNLKTEFVREDRGVAVGMRDGQSVERKEGDGKGDREGGYIEGYIEGGFMLMLGLCYEVIDMDDLPDSNILMEVSQFSIILFGIIVLIIIYSGMGALFEHKQIHFIHETGLGILIGFFFGLVVYLVHDFSIFQFDDEIFFVGLLPPMIFAGGYNLKKKKFAQNIKYIALYGLLGTVVSFGIIFGLTVFINQLGWILLIDGTTITLSLALMIKFAATICATDSVAALTLIKPKQFPKLFSIIFGEGMFNDAVAIILFKVVGGIFDQEADVHDSTIIVLLKILWSFVLTIVASLAIGLCVALICCKLFATFRFLTHNPVTEVVLLYLFGILSYVIAEILDMSGVLTVLVCGVSLAHFNFYNLSITGQLSTGVTFQTISFLAEAFVFVYLGASSMYYATKEEISFTFLGLQLLICVVSRWATIFFLSFAARLLSKKWTVSVFEQAIISMAGTIRGSVAFALILTVESHDIQAVSVIKSTTLFMVFITTIFLGAIMPAFVKLCLSKDVDAMRVSLVPAKKKKIGFFKMFDENYLKPFFIYNYVQRKGEILNFKKLLKLNSPEYKGGEFVALMLAGGQKQESIIETVKTSVDQQGDDDPEEVD